MPSSGQWMEHLKKITGVILLGSGVWFASRLLSDLMIVLSWTALIFLTLAYLVRPLVNMKMFKNILKGTWFLRVITFSMLACGVTVLIAFSAYEGRLVFQSSEIQLPLEYKDRRKSRRFKFRTV